MAINIPGPYVLKFNYLTDGLAHVMSFNADFAVAPSPGDDPVGMQLQTKGGTPVDLIQAIDDWMDIVKTFFSGDTEFNGVDITRVDGLNTSPVYITGIPLAITGTRAGNYTPAHQLTFTFRTQEGNWGKFLFMESGYVTNAQSSLGGTLTGNELLLRDFVIGNGSWMLARDTSPFIAGIRMSGTQNEKLYRTRFR